MAADGRSSAPARARASRDKPPALTEEQIVEAALEVIRTEGLEALSMRRLSWQLERSAMAAYWHVSDKQELLELVASKLLSRVVVPGEDAGPWDERLRTVIDGIDAQLHHHPGIASVLLERMRSTDRRLVHGILRILVSAGFRGPRVFLSYAMIHTYLFGRYQVIGFTTDLDVFDLEDDLAALTPHLSDLHGRDYFSYGVDTIIEGLRAQLTTEPASTPRRAPPPRRRAPRGG